MATLITVREEGRDIAFSLADLMKYHGHGYPGGVAHAFKVMERAFPLLDPEGRPERREITIETPFKGPGARDTFEMVTRAATGGRFTVVPGLAREGRGPTLANYVFRLGYRCRAVTLQIRDGHVRDEFIALGRKPDRTAGEESLLARMKQEMADRLMALPAAEIYDPD